MIGNNFALVSVFAATLAVIPGIAADKKTTDESTAQQIMGNNFIDLKTAAIYYRLRADEDFDTRKFVDIPFSEDTLRKFAKTHVLVPGFPMTIGDISRRVPSAFTNGYFDWWRNNDFATKERVHLQWYLIRKDIVSSRGLVSPEEEIPRACELVNVMVLYWLANAWERLFASVEAQSADDRTYPSEFRGGREQDGWIIVSGNPVVANMDYSLKGKVNSQHLGVASMWRPEVRTH